MQVMKRPPTKPRRVILYGVHGIGKSTWAAQAPKPLFIQTEDGIGDIECDRLPLCQSLSELDQALEFAYQSDYSTIALDSADWAERLIWESVCRAKGVAAITDIDYGKGYGSAMSLWETLVGGMNAIYQSGKSVILLAHSEIEKVTSPYGEAWDRYKPKLHKSAAAYLQEWADEVFFATYDVKTKEVKGDFGAKRQIPITSARVMYTTEKPTHLAKNRLGLPDVLPFDFAEFAKFAPAFQVKG